MKTLWHAFVITLILATFGCQSTPSPIVGGAIVGNDADVTITEQAGKVATESASLNALATSLNQDASASSKTAAATIRTSTTALDAIAAALKTAVARVIELKKAGAEYATQIGKLNEKVKELEDSVNAKGKWLYYVAIIVLLGGMGVGLFVGIWMKDSLGFVGAGVSFVLLLVVNIMLYYGRELALYGAIGIGVVFIATVIVLFIRFRGRLFEMASVIGPKATVRELKQPQLSLKTQEWINALLK